MKKGSIVIIILIVLLLISTGVLMYAFVGQASDEYYGDPIDATIGTVVTLDELYGNLEEYEGKNVIVKGLTDQYCLASGCWVLLKEGSRQILVQFYDFIYRPSLNTSVTVQGVVFLQNGIPYLAASGLQLGK